MSNKLCDLIEPELSFELDEKSSEVDGEHILGKVKGQFFVPDGVSRNNRFYPKSLWERIIGNKEIQEKLADRRMLGTISHNQELDDKAMLDGKMSHIVTKLSIVNGKGMGEALILGTPAGKILNTVLRAGSKLFVSSRARGDYNGKVNGVPKVDEDKYEFNTFDFVLDPGFLEANPSLSESIKKDIDYCFGDNPDDTNNNKEIIGESKMSDKMLETLIVEKNSLEEKLQTAVASESALKQTNEILSNESTRIKEELEASKKTILESGISSESVAKDLKEYKELGTLEEINKVMEKAEQGVALMKALKDADLGEDISKIAEAITSADKVISEYKEIGSPEDINKVFDVMEKFKEYDLGSPEEIKEAFDSIEVMVKSQKDAKKNESIKALAEKTGVSEEEITKLYDKMTEEEILELFDGLKESFKITSKFKKTAKEDVKEGNKSKSGLLGGTLGESLLRQFS